MSRNQRNCGSIVEVCKDMITDPDETFSSYQNVGNYFIPLQSFVRFLDGTNRAGLYDESDNYLLKVRERAHIMVPEREREIDSNSQAWRHTRARTRMKGHLEPAPFPLLKYIMSSQKSLTERTGSKSKALPRDTVADLRRQTRIQLMAN
jgi:hypothetical protein